jgi:hypothetical protein
MIPSGEAAKKLYFPSINIPALSILRFLFFYKNFFLAFSSLFIP